MIRIKLFEEVNIEADAETKGHHDQRILINICPEPHWHMDTFVNTEFPQSIFNWLVAGMNEKSAKMSEI